MKFHTKDKNTQELLRKLAQCGWTIARTSRGHYKATEPNGKYVEVLAGSGDFRAYKNCVARLRKQGVEL